MDHTLIESLEEGMKFSQFSKIFQRNIYACQTLDIALCVVDRAF